MAKEYQIAPTRTCLSQHQPRLPCGQCVTLAKNAFSKRWRIWNQTNPTLATVSSCCACCNRKTPEDSKAQHESSRNKIKNTADDYPVQSAKNALHMSYQRFNKSMESVCPCTERLPKERVLCY